MTLAQPDRGGIIRDETGTQTLLGYVVDISAGDGKGRCHLHIGPQHGNRHGMLHGGVIACLLDNAMGYAASLAADPAGETRFLTISMTTQFLAPARQGSHVTATGTVSGGGTSTLFVDGVLEDETGRLLATSTGVYRKVPESRT